MTGDCAFEGCPNPPVKLQLCSKHYCRDLRARQRSGGFIRPHTVARRAQHLGDESWEGSGQDEKVRYLEGLTLGELTAYCTGALSRAAILGDPTEIHSWQRLLREMRATHAGI